jgi:Ca2+-transporting ATPase
MANLPNAVGAALTDPAPTFLFNGLTDQDAASRLLSDGPNELPVVTGRGLPRIVFETMKEPMFLLLIGAAALYLVLGDLSEGLFLMAGAFATIGLVVLQEARSERALAALRDLSQPHARVVRGDLESTIPAHELVCGDMVLIGEGERLPADGALVSGDVLSVDESALTGESAPVSKRPLTSNENPDSETQPGAESGPSLFSGTLVVRGQGVVRIARTGQRTALGRIGISLSSIAQEPTPLQRTAGRLVTLLGGFAIAFCGVVVVAYGLMRHDWIGGALAGITVAIALIPEEFPMILAVFLALGAWRLASHRVLVRRSAVIEALGGATVLCVDRTGTLTENQMQVRRLWTSDDDVTVTAGVLPTGGALALLKIAGQASAVHPVDPMDKAVRSLLHQTDPAAHLDSVEPERVWPLTPDRMAIIQLWWMGKADALAAAKGAPEAIFRLCKFEAAEIARLEVVVEGFAEQGLRVLGVASYTSTDPFPDNPGDATFSFAGLVGFLDPVRKDVPAALKEARDAGIAVVMITGDHPATAFAIARAAGIDVSAGVMLGSEIAALPAEALKVRLSQVRVFARIVPEQKLLIVQALKAAGEVVAMTGDGVNDAPALEAAHIGIAMGKRGTDVAREAADLVLMDDSFASIVGGVRLGRRIFVNLRRALIYVTAIHVPIAGLALIPIVMGLPPMLFPMHVVFLELVIDPICAMVFEAEPSDQAAMAQPPRPRDEALFGLAQLALALLQGSGVLLGVFGLYVWSLGNYPQAEARGAAFMALVIGNLVLALADASSSGGRLFAPHRKIYWIIAGAAGAVLILVMTVPLLSALFRVTTLDLTLLALALAVGGFGGGWFGLFRSARGYLTNRRNVSPQGASRSRIAR